MLSKVVVGVEIFHDFDCLQDDNKSGASMFRFDVTDENEIFIVVVAVDDDWIFDCCEGEDGGKE